MAPKPLKGILKKPKLAGDYESSSEEEDMVADTPAPAPVGSTNTGTVPSTLPAGKLPFSGMSLLICSSSQMPKVGALGQIRKEN